MEDDDTSSCFFGPKIQGAAISLIQDEKKTVDSLARQEMFSVKLTSEADLASLLDSDSVETGKTKSL